MSRFQEHPYALEHRSMCPAAAKRRYGPMRCQHSPPGRGSSYLLFANATHKKGNTFAFTDNIVPSGPTGYGLKTHRRGVAVSPCSMATSAAGYSRETS
jgi:hypothetical protein